MRNISACHYMRCCYGNGLNPNIDNQNIGLVLKGHSHLLHMRITYHSTANLHITETR